MTGHWCAKMQSFPLRRFNRPSLFLSLLFFLSNSKFLSVILSLSFLSVSLSSTTFAKIETSKNKTQSYFNKIVKNLGFPKSLSHTLFSLSSPFDFPSLQTRDQLFIVFPTKAPLGGRLLVFFLYFFLYFLFCSSSDPEFSLEIFFSRENNLSCEN